MRPLFLFLCLGLAGCGATSSQAHTTALPAADAADARLARLLARDEERSQQITELSARLSMLEAEARDLRARLAATESDNATRAVRIGSHLRTENDRDTINGDAPRAEQGPRTVLTLYGSPQRAAAPLTSGARTPPADAVPFAVPAPPAGVSARLPVVALPGAAAPVAFAHAPAPATPVALTNPEDPAVRQYQSALGLFRAGQLEPAATALAEFVRNNPSHAYVGNALYWRGEVRYAQREYARAAAEFQSVLDRFPRGAKAADALLKIGLCQVRMGDRARAHATFLRVREQYPNTEAARAALREDPS